MNDQRSLSDQLTELYALANRNGLYDAADFVRDCIGKASRIKSAGKQAIVTLSGFGPMVSVPVVVLEETRMSYRVRVLSAVKYGHRNWKRDQELFVPKRLARFESEVSP